MILSRKKIEDIPVTFWGEDQKDGVIAIHGRMGNKEDEGITDFASIAVEKGFQVLSFDLSCHGERYQPGYDCKVQDAAQDLHVIMEYAKKKYETISLYACSFGAYFSLISYQQEPIRQCLFVSPVVDMKSLIETMMEQNNVSLERLAKEKRIEQENGQALDIDYYTYVCEHPVKTWCDSTSVLYGEKDNLTSQNTIENFCKQFHAGLTILKGSEHYLHTEVEKEKIQQWIKQNLCKK